VSFIDLVVDSNIEFEAPKRFYYWSALSAISAVLKDRVYFDMYAYKLYPNIYVLLYGPSGVRKGPPIALAEHVVKLVDNTRVINGRSSIEAIIKQLGTFQTRERKEPLKDSCGFVVASELSSSIISNPSAMDIFTNLYDRIYNKGEWKYNLKVGESHKLVRPTITWLSGTNEALFKEFLPDKNIHGGLIGRMFVVSEYKPGVINSLMFKPNIMSDDAKLAEALMPVSKMTGEFKMTEELRHEVDNWYQNFVSKIAPTLQDETGFVSRVEDFVIKNAMLIAAGRRCDLEIRKEDLEESFEVTLPLIVPTRKISKTLNNKKDPTEISKRGLVLSYISNQPNFTAGRKEILKNLSLQISHEDLDNVVVLLMQFDAIIQVGGGTEVIYRLNMENEKVAKWIKENYQK
jgi:hypothetical protein